MAGEAHSPNRHLRYNAVLTVLGKPQQFFSGIGAAAIKYSDAICPVVGESVALARLLEKCPGPKAMVRTIPEAARQELGDARPRKTNLSKLKHQLEASVSAPFYYFLLGTVCWIPSTFNIFQHSNASCTSYVCAVQEAGDIALDQCLVSSCLARGLWD